MAKQESGERNTGDYIITGETEESSQRKRLRVEISSQMYHQRKRPHKFPETEFVSMANILQTLDPDQRG